MSKTTTIDQYEVVFSTNFKKQYKRVIKQSKNIDKLFTIIDELAKGKILHPKYKDHSLINNKYYKDCRECHIEPDWLLIYQYQEERLVLLLLATGSHSELFK